MLNVTWLSEERGAAARATRIFLGGSLSQRGFLVALFEFYPLEKTVSVEYNQTLFTTILHSFARDAAVPEV